jgi:hypothetical protein
VPWHIVTLPPGELPVCPPLVPRESAASDTADGISASGKVTVRIADAELGPAFAALTV